MVSGHLRIKNGIYQAILNYTDSDGNYKQKSQSLQLPAKGNKKRAEDMLNKLRKEFVPPVRADDPLYDDMTFCDFLRYWLTEVQSTVASTTFNGYSMTVNGNIIPYFEKKHLKLKEVQAKHIQNFYMHELKRVKPITVKHEHAMLHKIFKRAYRLDLISCNPVEKVDPPRADRFIATPFTSEELKTLITGTENHKLGLIILMTALYGLRRSEVLGLRWKAIDFENNIISINHTLNMIKVDGKSRPVGEDRTKTLSSCRQFPLSEGIKVRLLARKEREQRNRKLCGNCYNHEWDGYVFVNELGDIISPAYIEYAFPQLLKELHIEHHRFHDLRHTCATMMNHDKIPLKEVQEYLGHSNIQTTANIYTHLDWSSKENSIKSMEKSVDMPEFKGYKDPWE